MFSLQASKMAAQLVDAGMDEKLAEVLLNVIGNCAQTLLHRGPIVVDTNHPDAPSIDPDDPPPVDPLDPPPSSITINNPGSTYNTTTNTIEGGTALNVTGVSLFNSETVFNSTAYFNSTIIWFGVTFTLADWGKVKVNAADALDYLEDQFTHETAGGVYVSDDDLIVKTETTAGKLLAFVDSSASFANWSSSAPSNAEAIKLSSASGQLAAHWDYRAITNHGANKVLGTDGSGNLTWLDTEAC